MTDQRGRFNLQDLNPGSYLLALNKPGYQIQFARVDSRLLALLQIRLTRDVSILGAARSTDPDSMDWVLRLPRSDVLKEERPAATMPSDLQLGEGREPPVAGSVPGGVVAELGAGRMPVSADVSQWYGSTLSGVAGNPGAPESTERTTALRVSGDILGRGNWEMRGVAQSRSLNSNGNDALAIGGEARDLGASRLRLAMHYDLSADDSVQVQARFDRDHFRSEGGLPVAAPPNQEVRTVGYQANWTRRMGEGNGLDLAMGFLEAQARIPEVPLEGGEVTPGADEFNDWHWNAGAGYQIQLPKEHRLSLLARSRIYNSEQREEGWILAPIRCDLSMLEAGQRGWSLSFLVEDSWKVSQPVSLLLGLETHLVESLERTVILVPRVGARREGASSSMQGWILVRANSSGVQDNGASTGSQGAESGPLGYHAEILRRFAGEWVLRGHVERNPLGAEEIAGRTGSTNPSSLETILLVDPSAWSRELGLAVSKNLRGIEGSLESDHGRIVGRMANALSDAPVQALEDGTVRYLALRATANVLKTNTQFRLNYTRLAGPDLSIAPAISSRASRVDLVVLQPISFVSNRGAGSWRVLFGYQGSSREALLNAAGAEPTVPEKIHRFSGGVGVSF